MRKVALLAALAVAGLAAAPAARTASAPETKQQLGREAFTYGFPLLEFLRVRATNTSVRCDDGKGDAPLNFFAHARRFATPADRTVVAPNVDTLYSIAQVDLGRGPVVLFHPAMGRRFFDFELVDPYTNVVGYVGSRTTGQKAGRFAITWTTGPKRARARIKGTKVVRSRYRRLWVIGRTLASTKADQAKAYRLMRSYRLQVNGRGPGAKECKHPGSATQARTPSGAAFLAALGRGLAENPPPARDKPLLRRLAAAGIGPGKHPTDPQLAAGVDAGAKDLTSTAKLDILKRALKNGGWVSLDSRLGRYGTGYAFRAQIALLGLGANTEEEATYPIALTDPSGTLLTGAKSYRLTFTKKTLPPARAFWSLTMYDGDGYLVRNAANRSAVGPFHPPLVKRADGTIVVVVSHARPATAGANWLPAPAGNFRLNLRLYWPRPSALNGTWVPPAVQPIG